MAISIGYTPPRGSTPIASYPTAASSVPINLSTVTSRTPVNLSTLYSNPNKYANSTVAKAVSTAVKSSTGVATTPSAKVVATYPTTTFAVSLSEKDAAALAKKFETQIAELQKIVYSAKDAAANAAKLDLANYTKNTGIPIVGAGLIAHSTSGVIPIGPDKSSYTTLTVSTKELQTKYPEIYAKLQKDYGGVVPSTVSYKTIAPYYEAELKKYNYALPENKKLTFSTLVIDPKATYEITAIMAAPAYLQDEYKEFSRFNVQGTWASGQTIIEMASKISKFDPAFIKPVQEEFVKGEIYEITGFKDGKLNINQYYLNVTKGKRHPPKQLVLETPQAVKPQEVKPQAGIGPTSFGALQAALGTYGGTAGTTRAVNLQGVGAPSSLDVLQTHRETYGGTAGTTTATTEKAGTITEKLGFLGKYLVAPETSLAKRGDLKTVEFEVKTEEAAGKLGLWDYLKGTWSQGFTAFGRSLTGASNEDIVKGLDTMKGHQYVTTVQGLNKTKQYADLVASGKDPDKAAREAGFNNQNEANYMLLNFGDHNSIAKVAANNPAYVSYVGTHPATSDIAKYTFGEQAVAAAQKQHPISGLEKAKMWGEELLLAPSVATGNPLLDAAINLALLVPVGPGEIKSAGKGAIKVAAKVGGEEAIKVGEKGAIKAGEKRIVTQGIGAYGDIVGRFAGGDLEQGIKIDSKTVSAATSAAEVRRNTFADLIRQPEKIAENPTNYDQTVLHTIASDKTTIRNAFTGNQDALRALTSANIATSKDSAEAATKLVTNAVKEGVSPSDISKVMDVVPKLIETPKADAVAKISKEIVNEPKIKQLDRIPLKSVNPATREQLAAEISKNVKVIERTADIKVAKTPAEIKVAKTPAEIKVPEVKIPAEFKLPEEQRVFALTVSRGTFAPDDIKRVLSMSREQVDAIVSELGEGNLGIKLARDVQTRLIQGDINIDEALNLLYRIRDELPKLCGRIC